jgi:hypothetical protein
MVDEVFPQQVLWEYMIGHCQKLYLIWIGVEPLSEQPEPGALNTTEITIHCHSPLPNMLIFVDM